MDRLEAFMLGHATSHIGALSRKQGTRKRSERGELNLVHQDVLRASLLASPSGMKGEGHHLQVQNTARHAAGPHAGRRLYANAPGPGP